MEAAPVSAFNSAGGTASGWLSIMGSFHYL